MKYQYTSQDGDFALKNPELISYLYFPIANEAGVMGSITPNLSGDSKMGQNLFLMAPSSSENLHNDKSSRNIWCKVNNTQVISLTGKSANAQANIFSDNKDESLLEAGFMYHTLTRQNKETGIKSKITNFVPASNETIEVMKVEIENTTNEQMEIQIVSAIPIYARSADNIRDHRHVTALLNRIYSTENGIIVEPTMTFDERGHKQNSKIYGVFGNNPIGFFPTVEDFIGEGGSLENPKAMYQAHLQPLNQVGAESYGYEALGGLCFDKKTLKSNEKVTYIIILGYGDDIKELQQVVNKFLDVEIVDKNLEYTKSYWKQKVNVSYHTANNDFDQWMKWVSFQPMLRRIYGCSFLPHHDYGKGGRGWRDLWQDCLALLIMNPAGVRNMLIDNFGGVRVDGTNATIIGTKQGEFIADRNNITRVWMDHGVWPLLTTDLYIQQTGDIEILLEKNTYFKDLQICRGEEKDTIWDLSQGRYLKTMTGEIYNGTIIEHLLIQNLTSFYDVGAHNHIKLRGADWNDALDMADENGESVAFTSMYAYNLEKITHLLKYLQNLGINQISLLEEIKILLLSDIEIYDDIYAKQSILEKYHNTCRHFIEGNTILVPISELIVNLKQKSNWIKEHIRKTEWIDAQDGNGWFNGYYDNAKRALEADEDNKMMLTSQVFMAMSKTATDAQVEKMIKSVDKHLYDHTIGGYKLNTNFKEVKLNMGRMFGFAYGHKENGAVFAHMTIMYSNALYARNQSNAAYKVIKTLFEHCNNFEVSKILPGIPEYIDAKGRGMYHYLTGSASWLLVTVITQMYGIRGDFGDLTFAPQLVKEQFDENKQASLSMTFVGKKIKVIYNNINNKTAGEYTIETIKLGANIYQNKIPKVDLEVLSDEQEHVIEIICS